MFRPYAQTRVLIDYDTFNDSLGKGVLICTNEGVLGAIRVLIGTYGLREVNWVTAHTPAGYIGVDLDQFDKIDSEISKFLGDTDNMNFCDEIVTILSSISNNLAGSGCECGGAGAGGVIETPSTENPGVPGNPQGGDTVPPGFADFAEYNIYKCDVAEWIVQQVENDLNWFQATNFVTLATTAFIAALLTPIPGDEIIALMGLLVSLALQGVATQGIGDMKNAVSNNRDAILCSMYAAANATSSGSKLTNVISDAIDIETTALYAPLLKSILGKMFNANNLNRLYVRWDEKVATLPTGVCTTCPCTVTTVIGVDQGGGNWDTAFHAPATDPPGQNVIEIEFESGSQIGCEVNDLLIVPTDINPSPPVEFPGYKLFDGAGNLIFQDDVVPPLTDGVQKVVIQSNTVGSAVITWTG